MKKNMKKLSIYEEIREHYELEGFVAVKKVFSDTTLARLRSDLVSSLGELCSKKGGIGHDTTFDSKLIYLESIDKPLLHRYQIYASKLNSLLGATADLQESLSIIFPEKTLYFEGMGFVFGIPKTTRLSYGWHQDGTYHQDDTSSRIHVWFPIFLDVCLENGAMSFLKGSHRAGVLGYCKEKSHSMGYTTNKVADIETVQKGCEELICSLNLGDCVIFSDTIVHRSNPNQTGLCRFAGVFKFSTVPTSSTAIELVGV